MFLYLITVVLKLERRSRPIEEALMRDKCGLQKPLQIDQIFSEIVLQLPSASLDWSIMSNHSLDQRCVIKSFNATHLNFKTQPTIALAEVIEWKLLVLL